MSKHALSRTTPETANEDIAVHQLIQNGWVYMPGEVLVRDPTEMFLLEELQSKVSELNPYPSMDPQFVPRAISKLRGAIQSTGYEGLVNSNRSLTKWLCGEQTVQPEYGSYSSEAPKVRLIDFNSVENNSFIVSDDVVYESPSGVRTKFDVVLWVNGIPVVVGETRNSEGTPWVDVPHASWVDAATSISSDHEQRVPEFFSTNIFSFAIGRGEESSDIELRFGGVRCPVNKWERWGSTKDPYDLSGLPRVKRSLDLLFKPSTLLSIVSDYTLYDRTQRNNANTLIKVTPRYPQVEAVEAIYRRALEPGGKQGLVIQHQGSGKTLAMAFAAIKLSRSSHLEDAIILVVADRKDLIDQVYRQFDGVGIGNLYKASDAAELKDRLRHDGAKVIVTTIQKFRGIGELNRGHNIFVLIDEAHRTQEGSLGEDMRTSLPNARFFGFTGTPIANKDKNTFRLFGSKDDPGWVLNEYTPDRSLADRTIAPIVFKPLAVEWNINAVEVEKAFNEMVEVNDLDEPEVEYLSSKLTELKTIMISPARIAGVCQSIVNHFYEHIDPQGMKAQIVAFDRATCVAYEQEIKRLLAQRGSTDKVEVVISYSAADQGTDLAAYRKSPSKVTEVTGNFNSSSSNLKFLIVTSMLCTGFDAPIEGVMYLDKPMRGHTLYQTMCRVNRKWENPDPEKRNRKQEGMVVDFFGLGEEVLKALAPANPNTEMLNQLSKEELLQEFVLYLSSCLRYFNGMPRTKSNIPLAKSHLEESDTVRPFVMNFSVAMEIWKLAFPDRLLAVHGSDFRWLAGVFRLCYTGNENAELIASLAAMTVSLLHDNIDGTTIDWAKYDDMLLDGDSLHALRGLVTGSDDGDYGDEPSTLEDVIQRAIENLMQRSGRRGDKSPYVVLIDLLSDTYEMYLEQVTNAAEALHKALAIMREADLIADSEAEASSSAPDAVANILRNLAPSSNMESRSEVSVHAESAIADMTSRVDPVSSEELDAWARAILDACEIHEYSPGLPSVLGGYLVKMSRKRMHHEPAI